MSLDVRKIQEIGNSSFVSIPQEYGFKKGELVKVELINENIIKITRLNGNLNNVTKHEETISNIKVE